MLCAALTLWDIQWEQSDQEIKADEAPIDISEGVVTRAFGLLELLLSIEQKLSKKVTQGTSLFCKSETRGAPEKMPADFNFEPKCVDLDGVMDSDMARRLLMRLKASDADPQEYVVHKNEIFKVLSTPERQTGLKFSIVHFKAIARRCPKELGFWSDDTLAVKFPDDAETDDKVIACETALEGFANVKMQKLRSEINIKASEKRGAAGRESRAKKKEDDKMEDVKNVVEVSD